jgi:hypothetical protein
MMNDELKELKTFIFKVRHSSFIIPRSSFDLSRPSLFDFALSGTVDSRNRTRD